MWSRKRSLQTPRSHSAVSVYKKEIFVFGGGGPNFKSLNSVERYDIKQDKWYASKPMLSTRSGAMAITIGDHIFVIGGGFKREDGRFRFLRDVDIFYPDEERWEKGPDMLMPHDYPSIAFLDNHIYIMGGHHPDATEGGPKTDPGCAFCERLNLNTMRWEEIAVLNIPRFALTAIVINNKILAMGGVALTSSGFNNFDVIEEYDSVKDKWLIKKEIRLPWPVAAHNSCLINGKLFVSGGYSGPIIHNKACVYEFSINKWNEIIPMDKPRAAFSLAQMGDYVYIIGGWEKDGSTVMSDVISYYIQ